MSTNHYRLAELLNILRILLSSCRASYQFTLRKKLLLKGWFTWLLCDSITNKIHIFMTFWNGNQGRVWVCVDNQLWNRIWENTAYRDANKKRFPKNLFLAKKKHPFIFISYNSFAVFSWIRWFQSWSIYKLYVVIHLKKIFQITKKLSTTNC